MPFNIIFPDGDSTMALDTLINQWADEGNDQFLYGSPNGVVLTLQRSALQEGTWTKHHREFDFNTHVNIPFSEDGHNVHYASTSISGALKLEASWEDPWKPHCALDLLLNCAQAALPALQLQRFPPISRNYYPKHLWISFSENDGPFEMLGQSITGLGSDFARWATQTTSPRTCTNQSLAEALALLSIRHLWPTQPNREFGRKAVQLSGRKMGIRLNLAAHGRYPGILQDLKDMVHRIPQHASKEMDQPHFAEHLLQWIFGGHLPPTKQQEIIQHEQDIAQEQMLSATNHEFREWLEKAHDKGLWNLFRSLRQKDHAWQRPFQNALKPENNSGELYGFLWRVHSPSEASKNYEEKHRTRPFNSKPLIPISSRRSGGNYQTKLPDLMAFPTTSSVTCLILLWAN